MADAAPDLEEVLDALFAHPLTNLGMVLRVLCSRRWHGMIERDGDAFGVGDAELSWLKARSGVTSSKSPARAADTPAARASAFSANV
jgi:hypothetical protein